MLPIDLAANAASLGAKVWRATTIAAFRDGAGGRGLRIAASAVIVVPVDRESRVGGYESWWDVPVAEVSTNPDVQRRARGLRRGAAQGARLSVIRVANAPCSWGALEFEATEQPAPASQVLDEMAAAGYAGTELGDWGFLPTDAGRSRGRRRAAVSSR